MKTYEVKKNLTNEELSTLIKLVKATMKESKRRGIEMSKTQARRLVLERLGWVSADREIESETTQSFQEGLKTADVRYNKPL